MSEKPTPFFLIVTDHDHLQWARPPTRQGIATSQHGAHMVPALIAAAGERAPPTHIWEK